MHSLFKKIVISLALLVFLPISAIAYDYDPNLGIVYINVENQFGEEISGTWYLHRSNLSGPIVRNGMKSYDFQTDEGYYYFEVRKVDQYEVFEVTTDITQFLNKADSITFNVTYYPDQEYMDAFLAGEIVEDPEPVEEEPEPAPEPEPIEEPEEEPEEEDLSGPITVTVISPTTPPVVSPVVPDFTTPPASPVEEDSEMDFGAILVLATTGPTALLLLLPSVAAGLYVATRRS